MILWRRPKGRGQSAARHFSAKLSFLYDNFKDAISGVDFSGKLMFGYGEDVQVYISAAPAKRTGPTLTIKLSM